MISRINGRDADKRHRALFLSVFLRFCGLCGSLCARLLPQKRRRTPHERNTSGGKISLGILRAHPAMIGDLTAVDMHRPALPRQE